MQLNQYKSEIRTIIRTIDDFEKSRVRVGNRLKKKKDGTLQKDAYTNAPDVTAESIFDSVDLYHSAKDIEDRLTKQLADVVKQTDEWKLYFKHICGIGPKLAGILIAEIDPYKAETVSKIWQYAGLNPSMVFGKKKDKEGNIIQTTDLIRGDKATSGYLLPYNGYLRMCVIGKIAPCLIKATNQVKYKEIYYGAKNYYSTNPKWQGESKGHIDNASKRKMMKQFLADYYAFVRPLYGLEARKPYAEEKMGIVHHNYES